MKYRTNTGCLCELRVHKSLALPLTELLNDCSGWLFELYADSVARHSLVRERDDRTHCAFALKLELEASRFALCPCFKVERCAAHRRLGKHEAHATLAEIDNLRLRGAL